MPAESVYAAAAILATHAVAAGYDLTRHRSRVPWVFLAWAPAAVAPAVVPGYGDGTVWALLGLVAAAALLQLYALTGARHDRAAAVASAAVLSAHITTAALGNDRVGATALAGATASLWAAFAIDAAVSRFGRSADVSPAAKRL